MINREHEKALVRSERISDCYKRTPIDADAVNMIIESAIKTGQGCSVIRLGDVMARLLTGHNIKSLARVADFLGMPYPPGEKFKHELQASVMAATVVGVSHFPGGCKLLKKFMQQKNWYPRHITDSFINDQLYYGGYLYHYLTKYRTCLIGRSAGKAAQRLMAQELSAALTLPLENYQQINSVLDDLKHNRTKFEVVLVGAGVPGRILCVKIAQQLQKPAIEIGHMMDAMANPEDWARPGNRLRFKRRWVNEQKQKPCTE
jgi:hypothetical protein